MSDEIISKLCSKCKETKPVTNFYRNKTGHCYYASVCKECEKARSKSPERRTYNKEYLKAYHKRPEVIANWTSKTTRELARKYRATPKRKEHTKQYEANLNVRKRRAFLSAERRRKKPAHYRARQFVTNHVQWGKLPRASTLKCIKCNRPANQYHHHKGYAKEYWLDVVPMCQSCHSITQRKT